MKKLRLPLAAVAVLLLATILLGGYQGRADSAAVANKAVTKAHDAAAVRAKMDKRVTNEERAAAAERAAKKAAAAPAAPLAAPPAQGGTPNYFGPEPNWAYSPQPIVDALTGLPTSGGIHKFVDALPNLVIATPDTTTYPGSDYYEIALVQYTQKMHTDLNPTTLRGYVQISTSVVVGAHSALTYPNGQAIKDNAGNPVYAVAAPSYLGPAVVATKNKPVRVKFTNYLPLTAAGGDLFLPVDTTEMGAGMGPLGMNVTAGQPHELRAEPRDPPSARRSHPVDQRRHAPSVDHAGGREDRLSRRA